MEKEQTPEELLREKISAIKTNADLLEVLQMNPPENWIEKHPDIPDHIYLAIDKNMLLLRLIFGLNFKIKIIRSSAIFNAASVTVRVLYREFDEPREWFYHDGIGADAPEFSAGKHTVYAVSKSVPLAKSLALKNACRNFGPLFGSELKQKYKIKDGVENTPEEMLAILKTMFEELEAVIPADKFIHYKRIIVKEETNSYSKLFNTLSLLKTKTKNGTDK